MDPAYLQSVFSNLPYLAVFLVVFFSGILIPLPEEIVLLTVGYVSSAGNMSVLASIIVAYIAMTASDNMIFWLSRSGSKLTRRLRKNVEKKSWNRYGSFMKRHFRAAIFALRFIMGLRLLSPLLAGNLKVRWVEFQLYDGLALALYTPLLILLGYHFHASFSVIITEFELLKHALFIFAIFALAIPVGMLVRKLVDMWLSGKRPLSARNA